METSDRLDNQFCVYDHQNWPVEKKTKAVGVCYNCEVGLCSSCGYTVGGQLYCNQCYEDIEGMCSRCGTKLAPQWENQGFDGVSGPRHDEVVGYYPCECLQEDDL